MIKHVKEKPVIILEATEKQAEQSWFRHPEDLIFQKGYLLTVV